MCYLLTLFPIQAPLHLLQFQLLKVLFLAQGLSLHKIRPFILQQCQHKQMIQKSITAVYCDDVRNEIGGKLSFMGVYGADLLFPTFPATLQKLCVHVVLRFPHGEQPKQNLHVVLLKDEEVLAESKFDETHLDPAKVPDPDLAIPPEDRLLAIVLGFVIVPFQVERPARIRLRAYVDGEEIKGNGLRIRLANEEERKNFGMPPLEESSPP
jgi:hypothetical protein